MYNAVECNLTKLTTKSGAARYSRWSAVFGLVTCLVQRWLDMTDCKHGVLSSMAVSVSIGGVLYYPSLPLNISPLTYSVWPALPYFPLTYSVWRVSGQRVGAHGWVAGIASHESGTSPQGPWHPTSITYLTKFIPKPTNQTEPLH